MHVPSAKTTFDHTKVKWHQLGYANRSTKHCRRACRHICAKYQPVQQKCLAQLIKHDSWFEVHTAAE
jgi:hypothetical protein